MKRKPIHLSQDVHKIVVDLATAREIGVGEAGDHLVKVGATRIKALKTYSKAVKKAKRAVAA